MHLNCWALQPHQTHSYLVDTGTYFEGLLFVVLHSPDRLTINPDLVRTHRVSVVMNTIDGHLS